MDASWTTKTGKVLKINEMSTEHLKNAINFLTQKIEDFSAIQMAKCHTLDDYDMYGSLAEYQLELPLEQLRQMKLELEKRQQCT